MSSTRTTASPRPAALLRMAAEAPIGICHVDGAGNLSWVNPALAHILGFPSPDDLVAARTGSTLFHAESTIDSLEALAGGREQFSNADALLTSAEGAPVEVRIDGTAMKSRNGATWLLYVRASGTEKSREIELARALAELDKTMQTIPDILYTLDVEARLVRWNRKLQTATGYEAADLQGKPGFELFPEAERTIFAKAIMDAFARGYVEFETNLLARDETTTPYQWTAVPLEDAEGKVVGLAGAGRDISERRRNEEARENLEQALRNRAREWQITFDSLDSPIVMADLNGVVVRMNRAALETLEHEEFADIVGHPVEAWDFREPWGSFARLLSSSESTASPAVDPVTRRAWDVAISRVSDLRTKESLPLSILIARDVTRMLELQEVARRNQVMSAVGSLIVGVAHEVRNPIFGISATLDAFETSFPIDADSRQFIEVLRGEIGRLSELMQELLDYGRPTKPELVEAKVQDVIHQALRTCGRIADKNHVRLVTEFTPDLPHVRIDRKKLLQVFQNLIENAIQFSPPEGEVTLKTDLSADEQGEWVTVTVIDSGPGFSAGEIDRIFEPFYTRRRGGTGLGLSIVQRLVDEHHGRIRASNRPEGGAQVVVLLPAHPPRG
ncbi:MAG: ATP-binding protein [Thermoanaerobaculia bacterium]